MQGASSLPRILIVDDERNFRRFLGEALKVQGYEVDHAATARVGLAVARERHPNVVLLDQNLPDGSGLDMIPQLRALTPTPAVVIITAYAECSRAVDAVKAGAFPQDAKNSLGYVRVVVAQKMRREGCMVIDIAVTIGVPNVSALTFDKNDFRECSPVY